MQRRDFLRRALATALPLSVSVQRAATAAPRSLKITGVDVIVTNPEQTPNGNYVLVKISTNEAGIFGWGDATCTGSELAVAKMLEEHLMPALLGQNPMQSEAHFQRLYLLPYYRSGSVQMSAISGIDMALWDIKGKVAGLPVYELLGGKVRDKLLTYWTASGRDPQQVEENVRKMMARGYKVIKVQVSVPGADGGYAVPLSERQKAVAAEAYNRGAPPDELWEPEPYVRILPKLFEHLRKTVGEEIGLLHDVHERVTPNQALQLAKTLEPYRLFYFEDPLRPEHLDTFRLIRQQSSIPIAMGEIYTGAWEGHSLVTEHLIDYVRHDLAHCGGVTTGKKVAIAAEPYGILTAWHGPGNIAPPTHFANCHVSLSIPNFGIQEESAGWGERTREVFSAFPEVKDGYVTIGDTPGLGCTVNEAAAKKYPYVRRLRPAIRRLDGTPWPY